MRYWLDVDGDRSEISEDPQLEKNEIFLLEKIEKEYKLKVVDIVTVIDKVGNGCDPAKIIHATQL